VEALRPPCATRASSCFGACRSLQQTICTFILVLAHNSSWVRLPTPRSSGCECLTACCCPSLTTCARR
jgi:hypothetical protein